MASTNTTSSDPLAYLGIDKFRQPTFLRGRRDPTTNDKQIAGVQWYNDLTQTIYISRGNGLWSTLASSASPSGITWINNATSSAMLANHGYIVTTGAQVFTLPTTSVIGDRMEVVLNGGTSWQIAQGAGQSINVNAATTTVDTGGSITTNAAGQAISLICIQDNTKWYAKSLIGNPPVV